MINNKADRIQNAINHIKTATDIDPWAMEIAVEAMEKELKNSTQELKNPNDAISRQAAIRWVKTECNPYGKPTLDFESGKRVMEHLKTMPSVQPDIIACGDCKHYIPHNKRCGYWNHGVKPLEWCSQAERWWKE